MTAESELFSDPRLAAAFSAGLEFNDPSDPPVFRRVDEQPEYTLPGTFIGKRTGRTVRSDDTDPLSDTDLDIFRAPAELQSRYGTDLQSLQVDLYAGGFYDDLDPDEIAWGGVDEATQRAWQRATRRAASYYAAGQKLTVTEVLALARQQGGAGFGSGGSGGGGRQTPISLSDPAGLASRIDDIARGVVGRKASADERRMFVRLIHEAQRSGQSALGAGGTGVGVDVDAQAEALLRQQNPLEAEGHDFATTMATFNELISQMGQS